MSETDPMDVLAPIYDGFRQDYFLAWLEEYGLLCIPNFVARVEEGELVLHLLEHVTVADLAEIDRRMGDAGYRIAESRLTWQQIQDETGFQIPE